MQTRDKTDNTLRARTVSAICLRPTGNVQGSFYYYSLVTGRRLHRRRCTALPMPDEVINRVHDIATRQKCPEGIIFLRRDGTEFIDIPGEAAPTNDDDPDDEPTRDAEIPGVGTIDENVENPEVDFADEELNVDNNHDGIAGVDEGEAYEQPADDNIGANNDDDAR